jgi:ABC-type amino acid transport system permease subunit
MALGMTRGKIFKSILAPQSIKIAIPNIGSMYIGMIKDTSTFAIIGMVEVVRVTQN